MAVMISVTGVCKRDELHLEIMALRAHNTGYDITRLILLLQKNWLLNDNQAVKYKATAALSWRWRDSYKLSGCLVALLICSPPACRHLRFLSVFSRWKARPVPTCVGMWYRRIKESVSRGEILTTCNHTRRRCLWSGTWSALQWPLTLIEMRWDSDRKSGSAAPLLVNLMAQKPPSRFSNRTGGRLATCGERQRVFNIAPRVRSGGGCRGFTLPSCAAVGLGQCRQVCAAASVRRAWAGLRQRGEGVGWICGCSWRFLRGQPLVTIESFPV